MKPIRGSKSRASSLALLPLAAWSTTLSLACGEASGAELRPLTLPSQSEVREPRRAPPPARVVDEQFYRDFGMKVKTMPPAEREKLLRAFTERRDSAEKGLRVDEAAHYERLLTILRAR